MLSNGPARVTALPTVSVVVCAYTLDRWSTIQAAVESVLSQEPGPHEVFLVVDHCPDLEDRARSELSGSGVRVLGNDRRPGLSGARNVGWASSSGEVVAFLDDDADAEAGWLRAHAEQYRDPRVLGVGGHVDAAWDGGRPRWFPDEFGWVVGCSYAGLPTTTAEVRNPIGANMSFRRDVLAAVGGFREDLGRVGSRPLGCEETELAIRAVQAFPDGCVVHQPGAVVHHHVAPVRGRWHYFRSRCWAEGRSKAAVRDLAGPRRALSSERSYVLRTLPVGVARSLRAAVLQGDTAAAVRATVIVAGVAVTTAGYVTGRLAAPVARPQGEEMSETAQPSRWLSFDVHGRLGVRVERTAPTAPQLRAMLECFSTDSESPPDIVVTGDLQDVGEVSDLENEARYNAESVELVEEGVQVVRRGSTYEVHGRSELLTALVPVLDRAMVERGAAMIHAATVGYHGYAVAMPAAGGTGKTSTVAKVMRRQGFSFMGDDWAFLSEDNQLLGYLKPMFIKPHHRPIYPHLFQGARKPMVPMALSRPVGKVTSAVHPVIIRYPRLADLARRWSPEHRMVSAEQALPGVPVTTSAPLLCSVYVERHSGVETELHEVSEDWMVDRMLGNFHVEMATFSQKLVTALAAGSVVTWREYVDDKAGVLAKGLAGVPCYVLQVPRRHSADQASDAVVTVLDGLLPRLLEERGGRP